MEVTCPRCKAVFFPQSSSGLCPNCGYNVGTPLARLRRIFGGFLGPIALLAWGLYLARDGGFGAFIFVVGSLIWAWSIYNEKSDYLFRRPVVALNLDAQKRELDFIPLTKPEMPESWRPLAMIPPPRGLQSTAFARRETVVVAFFFLALAFELNNSVWNDFVAFVRHPAEDIWNLIFPAFCIYAAVITFREARIERTVLRDGLLATGLIANCTENRYGTSTTYQFWTDSGQKFEGHGKLDSKLVAHPELSLQQEPLKVFYLPQNPCRNVALSCATLRIAGT